MKRKASLYIKDIMDAITRIEGFLEGMDFNSFIKVPPLKPSLERIHGLLLEEEEK